MKYSIDYNSQRNNESFGGKFPGYAQCFSTCVFMLMSYYDKTINANDDKLLAKYVDDVEIAVGSIQGLADELKKKNPSISGKSSLFWDVQQYGLQTWLSNRKIQGDAKLNLNAGFEKMIEVLNKKPVIIGTNKMGGLPGGHIILGIGYDDKNIIINDPFGNAIKNYEDQNGKAVLYSKDYLQKYFSKRIMWWEN